MFLTPDEIHKLTGKMHKPAQRRALNLMGIEHKVRPDGMLIISRAHIEKILDGNEVITSGRSSEPNWDAV